MKRNSISLIVPVFNEEENIKIFVETCCLILNKLTQDWRIIFVNDGSKDDTLKLCMLEREKEKRIEIIDFSRNFGKEQALTAGLERVTTDCAIPIDVDLQDPPKLIEEMYNLWKSNLDIDVVYAKRISREGETLFKRVSASLFYKVMDKLSDIEIPKNVGDFRLIDKEVLKELNKLPESNRFMKGLFSFVGFNQVPLDFHRKPRYAGETNFNLLKLSNLAIDGITSFSSSPLRFILYSGVGISLISFIYLLFILFKTIWLGVDLPGYSSIIISILFFGGVQLIAIGILGEYIGKIYTEVKRRPLYIIKKIYE